MSLVQTKNKYPKTETKNFFHEKLKNNRKFLKYAFKFQNGLIYLIYFEYQMLSRAVFKIECTILALRKIRPSIFKRQK